MAPVAIGCVWFGGVAWYGLLAAAAVAAGLEWRRLCGGRLRPLSAGFAFLGLVMAALAWLRADPLDGVSIVAFLLVVVWSSDVGAYGFGRLVGGPRLAPSLSPGKTWSGAAGGLACAVFGGLLAAPIGSETLQVGVIAATLGIAAQMGDLAESALKRRFGVKDSGSLIPGHGGVLDRLDGLMAAAPVAVLWVLWLGRGDAMWR